MVNQNKNKEKKLLLKKTKSKKKKIISCKVKKSNNFGCYTNQDVANALKEHQNGLSLMKAAKKYRMSETTLYRYKCNPERIKKKVVLLQYYLLR